MVVNGALAVQPHLCLDAVPTGRLVKFDRGDGQSLRRVRRPRCRAVCPARSPARRECAARSDRVAGGLVPASSLHQAVRPSGSSGNSCTSRIMKAKASANVHCGGEGHLGQARLGARAMQDAQLDVRCVGQSFAFQVQAVVGRQGQELADQPALLAMPGARPAPRIAAECLPKLVQQAADTSERRRQKGGGRLFRNGRRGRRFAKDCPARTQSRRLPRGGVSRPRSTSRRPRRSRGRRARRPIRETSHLRASVGLSRRRNWRSSATRPRAADWFPGRT